jgi:GNAT superfamily N-acetyltransferase
MSPIIRPGRDSDGPALIALIWSCWSAYPGVKMDVDGEMPELHALATYYAGKGGALWVAEDASGIVGMIATRPGAAGASEICRVYVSPPLHGSGLGATLLAAAENYAIAAGAVQLVLWTDTRFDRAHRFYEKHSYVRHGPVRVLNDVSNSLEYAYAKPADGIQVLDIAAAASAVPRLTEILVACVNGGASVNFLAPLEPDKAKAYWQQAARDAGTGRKSVLALWRGGALVGTGTLDLATPENQRHRAEVQKVLVHPQARGRGLGRAIMRALEEEARRQNRSLLTLVTRGGDAAETLYRSEHWIESGRIPDFARGADGAPHEAVFFRKTL